MSFLNSLTESNLLRPFSSVIINPKAIAESELFKMGRQLYQIHPSCISTRVIHSYLNRVFCLDPDLEMYRQTRRCLTLALSCLPHECTLIHCFIMGFVFEKFVLSHFDSKYDC